MPELCDLKRRPVYLQSEGPRILDNATIAKVGDVAWFDLQTQGLLLRITLTRTEIAEMIEVLRGVEDQFRAAEE